MTRQWDMHEIVLKAAGDYALPFTDIDVEATFIAPSGKERNVLGFYDGNQTWRVRFSPDEAGHWQWQTSSEPFDGGLGRRGAFDVDPAPEGSRGMLRVDKGAGWGFRWDNGHPAFFLGDTMYNLFGYDYCGHDPRPILELRRQQGHDLVRVRAHATRYHHRPDRFSPYLTKSCWPWGGIEQAPRFELLNLEYFASVDRVMNACQEMGILVELILEAWLFEFPFNDRSRFTAEDEELWFRYIVARYGAYRALAMWTLANEYIYYPAGNRKTTQWDYEDTRPDRWQARLARLVRATDPHGHPIAVHTMDRVVPTYADRLRRYPEIDVILFQDWGDRGPYAWTAHGIDEAITEQIGDARQVGVLAEYGYEAVDGLAIWEGRRHMTPAHSRRGAWRGCMSGVMVMCGYENTWGPHMRLTPDAPGAEQMIHLRRFFTELADFRTLRTCTGVVSGGRPEAGGAPLCLADEDRKTVVVYLPLGGSAEVRGVTPVEAIWYDPRTGKVAPAELKNGSYLAPPSSSELDDTVLLLRS